MAKTLEVVGHEQLAIRKNRDDLSPTPRGADILPGDALCTLQWRRSGPNPFPEMGFPVE